MISFTTTFDKSIIIRGGQNIWIDEALEETFTFFFSLMISTELQCIQFLNLKYTDAGLSLVKQLQQDMTRFNRKWRD
jgi:hypothetical protein